MTEITWVQDLSRGVHPGGSLPKSIAKHVVMDNAVSPRKKRLKFLRVSTPETTIRLSILAQKEVAKLFGCERIEVEVPSIDLVFESSPASQVETDLLTAYYRLARTRVVQLKVGNYRVNLKRWQPVVKFETEKSCPRWPQVGRMILWWIAKRLGVQNVETVEIHCASQDARTLQVTLVK